MNQKQRLPLGSILRDEVSGCFYFLIKAESYSDKIVYNFCCIFDPRQRDQTSPLTFNFLIDNERASKLTVINTNIATAKDGSTIHSLTYICDDNVDSLYKNAEFMLRYMTACKFFTKGKKRYKIISFDPVTKLICVSRKSSWFERVLTGADYLNYKVNWMQLLDEFIPYIPPDLNEQEYKQSIIENCYFCKGREQ